MTTVRALVLGCSLKASPAPSSSELLGRELLAALTDHEVDGEEIRVVVGRHVPQEADLGPVLAGMGGPQHQKHQSGTDDQPENERPTRPGDDGSRPAGAGE